MTPTPTPTAAEAREALNEVRDDACRCHDSYKRIKKLDPYCNHDTAPYVAKLEQFIAAHPDAPPAAEGVRKFRDYGFNTGPWTYTNQPGNVGAWGMGIACRKAMEQTAGDPIDRGLILLRELQAEGFGVYAIGVKEMPADEAAQVEAPPIPMVLYCPRCRAQHIDAPDERTPGWENPPHRSHLCHGCGFIWRPADVATVGVAAIQTRGKNDSSPEPASAEAVSDAAVEAAAREVRAFAFPADDDQTRSILDVIAEAYGDEDIEHASETLDEMMYAALAAAHPAMVAETARLRDRVKELEDHNARTG